MKKWKITGVIAAVLLLAVIGVCIYRANKDIPLAEKQYYKIGDTVAFDKDILVSGESPMDGYSIRIDSAEVLDLDEFLEKYNGSPDDFLMEPPEKVYDLTVTLSNDDNEGGGLILYEFYLQNKAAIAGFNLDCYKIANAKKGYREAGVAVRPGTSVTFQVPFTLYENLFNRQTWENIEEYPMYLTASLYPHKKMIWLK